mmetsp:Transcript_20544/g.61254  ORF Transcript_20544/g.61254 Transcript_20544/m.61254 type:complete len:262 (-) Transcript_20544:9-794(-)
MEAEAVVGAPRAASARAPFGTQSRESGVATTAVVDAPATSSCECTAHTFRRSLVTSQRPAQPLGNTTTSPGPKRWRVPSSSSTEPSPSSMMKNSVDARGAGDSQPPSVQLQAPTPTSPTFTRGRDASIGLPTSVLALSPFVLSLSCAKYASGACDSHLVLPMTARRPSSTACGTATSGVVPGVMACLIRFSTGCNAHVLANTRASNRPRIFGLRLLIALGRLRCKLLQCSLPLEAESLQFGGYRASPECGKPMQEHRQSTD